MGIIRVLDEHVANLIAAGEVVERPASVVKELVENAIDAGADDVRILIEEGGLQLIRVSDNGRGIGADDVSLAFQRHATSKVWESRDLSHIRTLGFRGEALPSIASVARVECVTSSDKSGLGTLLAIEGGTVKRVDPARTTRGTDIFVRDLFYNTPARLKYMKTVQTEFGHISDYVSRISLAHPNIAFTLHHNDRSVLKTPGGGDLRQTIAAIYGTAAARAMVEVRAENADFALAGWIGKPELTRANRYGMTTIVNGRYVRSYALQNAVIQAYHTLLPINRFPLVILQLVMDPSLVDVNVHPAKLEVRFSKERELTAFVEAELGKLLRGTDLIPRIQASQVKKNVIHEQIAWYDHGGRQAPPREDDQAAKRPAESAVQEETNTESGRSSGPGRSSSPSGTMAGTFASGHHAAGRSPDMKTDRSTTEPRSSARPASRPASAAGLRPETHSVTGSPPDWKPFVQLSAQPAAEDSRKLPELHVIGQMHGTYIIAQNEEGLYLIDQHAAHERINYERFYQKFGQPEQASQELLVPITLEFTAAEADKLRDKSALFEQIGVYMEPFGGNTFIIRSVPEWMPKGDEHDIVQEMAEWALQDRSLDIAKLREKSAILTACKASLKANDYLSRAEIDSLLKRLGECASPFTCPHGRPIIVSFSTYELEKMFKRVM